MFWVNIFLGSRKSPFILGDDQGPILTGTASNCVGWGWGQNEDLAAPLMGGIKAGLSQKVTFYLEAHEST